MLKTNSDLGAEIARARKEKGWSQAELAKQSGVSRGTISIVETNQRVSGPSWNIVRKLDEALDSLSLSYSYKPASTARLGLVQMGLEALALGLLLSDEGKLLVNVEGGHKVLTQEMLAALAAG